MPILANPINFAASAILYFSGKGIKKEIVKYLEMTPHKLKRIKTIILEQFNVSSISEA